MPQLATLLEEVDLGLINWPTTMLGELTIKRTIEQEYQRLSGGTGTLGPPAGPVQAGSYGGQYQLYAKGAIYWSSQWGAHGLYGDIAKKYQELGAESGFLGYPVTPVLTTSIGREYAIFEHGVIFDVPSLMTSPEFKSDKVSAVEIHGSILAKYRELHAYDGFLGYPTTDEHDTGDGVGRFSRFQHGAVYWSPATGPHEVHGAIASKYDQLWGPTGILGYPITDETKTPDTVGRYNHFQHGSIYWTPTTGAHEVHGAIREQWKASGWEKGPLGYPTSDEFTIPGTNGRRSVFERGAIDWYPGKGATTVAHSYDLKALDWCYTLDPTSKWITFKAVVGNAGTTTVTGVGEVVIGVSYGSIIAEKEQAIPSGFSLAPGETAVIGGVAVPFATDVTYSWLEYRFNIHGEPFVSFCDAGFLEDLKAGKNNNGRTFFLSRSGADVGDPKGPQNGAWILANGKTG